MTARPVRIGTGAAALLESTEKLAADLIVVGTRGRTGLDHLLLGSTAERVVQRAPCPVLAVHPNQRPRPIRTLLLPTDFSRDSERTAERARNLLHCEPKEVRLILLHAYFLPVEFTAYGPIPTSPGYLQDVAGEAERRLLEAMEPLQAEGYRVETLAREGYPPEVIVGEARRLHADLIAMATHGRSGLEHLMLGSTAERVVQRAPCPVLTVRRQEE